MNFYYPYYLASPVNYNGMPRLFSNLFNYSNINLNSILNGAQRTLGLVNQALPIIKEAAPMIRNARTLFKVMNEFKKVESPSNNFSTLEKTEDENRRFTYIQNQVSEDGPVFFA